MTPADCIELDERITRPSTAVRSIITELGNPIVVLGAGGKMGFHLCRMLQRAAEFERKDHKVVAVSRFSNPQVMQRFRDSGIDVIAADLADSAQVDSLPAAQTVFFLAGVKFGTSTRPELLHRMNVLVPRIVAAKYQTSKIISLSTGCVYDFVSAASGGSSENSPTCPPGAYAQSCLQREQEFLAGSERWGTSGTIIRLNYSNELRYGVLVDLAQKVDRNEPIDVSMGHVNLIWQGDAIDHIIRSTEVASSPPFILNITGLETLRVRDLAQRLGERLGKTPSLVGSESETAWLSDARQAASLFGEPVTTIDQMIEWVSEWIRQGGELLNKPTKFEIRDGDY